MKLTQAQRADIWQRKDALAIRLRSETNETEIKRLQRKIEACNQELITETYDPPALADEPAIDPASVHPLTGTLT